MSNVGTAELHQTISEGISFQLPTHLASVQSVVGGENQAGFESMNFFFFCSQSYMKLGSDFFFSTKLRNKL